MGGHDGPEYALPTHLSVNDLSRLFGVPEEKLPKQAELSLYAGDHTLTTAARRVCGRELYRLNQRSWEVPQDFACEEHTLRLSSPEGRVYSAQAEKGEALDEELPWVFVDHESEIRFLKQGSGKVSDEKAWIALGDIWKVEEGVCRTKTAEDLNGFGRKIIEVEGSVKAISTTGLKFGLKTGHVGADDEDFYWKGDRVWLDFKGPRIAFRGVPDLYKKSDEAISRKVTEDLAITSLGASGAGATIGPVVASYPKNGEVEFRSRALLLGPRASLRINPQDAKSGEIILEQWGAESARVCNEHVSQHQDRYGNDRIRISVGVPAGRAAPERLELEVLWKNSTVPSRLEIPFPARGARLFGPSGAELDSGSLIPSGSLIGTRMVLASARPGTSYDLELSNTSLDVKRRHKLSSIGEGEVREIRLQDYLDDVIQLLSADDSPDSQVEIRISEKGQIFFSFGVARYCTALDIQGSEVGVTSTQLAIEGGGDLSEIGLYAIRLQDPEDEPVRLPPALTEGVRTGNWRLDPIENEAGDWLVFPEGKAGKFIRPLLWSSPNELEAAGGLSAAVGKREQEQRMAAISECLDEMALDFFNDGWLFLERLYDHVSHLPLVTLDIWRCLAQHEDAMAAVSLRFGRVPTKMLERMPKELPTAWEVVSAASWRNSMERLSDQCQRLFGDNANAVLSSHLKDRLEFLQALCPPIAYLLGILSVKYLPEGKREAEIIRTVIGHYAEEALFFGAGSELMKLRRHHADDEWPNDAVSAFQRAPKAPTDAGVLHSFEPAYQNNVANLPALIACQVSRGETDYWLSSAGNISAIKSAQAFDPDWFEEAFSRTVARCYAEGILDNE